MDADDDSPQIGLTDVDVEALREAGIDLGDLLEELGMELDETAAADTPAAGWRVLKSDLGGSLLLGAPVDPEARNWRIAHAQAADAGGTVHVHPDIARLRASRAGRRKGLELRWPLMMNGSSGDDGFFIDIVNTGASRWVPDGDGFFVAGAFTELGMSVPAIGWASIGHDKAVPLGPGEYARVTVAVDNSQWASLEPGWYHLHAVLVGLGLGSTRPVSVNLSAETIARSRGRARSAPRSAEDHRRAIDEQIARLRAQIAAASSLEALTGALTVAGSDDDAIARIAALIGCDTVAAASIYHSPLRELRPGRTRILEKQLKQLIRTRGD